MSRNGSKKLVFLLFNRWTTYKVFFFIFMHDALIVRRQKNGSRQWESLEQKNGSCQWESLETKNGSCQWKNVENVWMKQIAKLLKKINTFSVIWLYYLKEMLTFFTAVTLHLNFLQIILKEASASPTALHLSKFLMTLEFQVREREPYKHTTWIRRWNDVETTVSTSFQSGIHVVCL